MTDEAREYQANKYGPTGLPTPPDDPGESAGEAVAVPSGDLTGAIDDAVEETTTSDNDR